MEEKWVVFQKGQGVVGSVTAEARDARQAAEKEFGGSIRVFQAKKIIKKEKGVIPSQCPHCGCFDPGSPLSEMCPGCGESKT